MYGGRGRRAALPAAATADGRGTASGRHAAFLTTALHKGEPLIGYVRPEHPVQQRVARALEEMTGIKLARTPRGIDDCGMPVYAIPLGALASAMARFVAPDDLPPPRATAARRICAAMAARPILSFASTRMTTFNTRPYPHLVRTRDTGYT